MAVTARWIIDKSAYVRLPRSPDVELWLSRIERGLVSAASVTLLELGFLARSAVDWTTVIRRPPVSKLRQESVTVAMEERAIEVQGLLAERGHHRAVKIPDLLIAAVAERSGLTVLHLDKDFDLIAEVTGQPVERLTGEF